MKNLAFVFLVFSLLTYSEVRSETKSKDECQKCYSSTCKSFQTCSEAMFCLNQCGVKKLDSDNDGIPCECNACKNMNRNPERCEIYRYTE